MLYSYKMTITTLDTKEKQRIKNINLDIMQNYHVNGKNTTRSIQDKVNIQYLRTVKQWMQIFKYISLKISVNHKK